MNDVRGVRVIDPDGNQRVYTEGREITRDGFTDYEIRGARGQIIATRKRDTVAEIELIFP